MCIFIINAVIQLALLFLLIRMGRMMRRAIKLHKLQAYYRENRFPRYSVRLFTVAYIFKALICIMHAVWACIQLHQMKDDGKPDSAVMKNYLENSYLLLLDEITELLTVLLSIAFFMILARNMRKLRERVAGLQLIKSNMTSSTLSWATSVRS